MATCSSRHERSARVSLRNALAALSDDRGTQVALGEVLSFFSRNHDPADAARVARATGLSPHTTERILRVLADAGVLDCSGDPPCYRYHSDTITDLEVSRYLRTRSAHDSKVQGSVDRFRSHFGR